MKPTEKQIDSFDEKYRKAREEEYKDGVIKYINTKLAERQEQMAKEGMQRYSFRWALESHRECRRIFKYLGIKYHYDYREEFKNFGFKLGVLGLLTYYLSLL